MVNKNRSPIYMCKDCFVYNMSGMSVMYGKCSHCRNVEWKEISGKLNKLHYERIFKKE